MDDQIGRESVRRFGDAWPQATGVAVVCRAGSGTVAILDYHRRLRRAGAGQTEYLTICLLDDVRGGRGHGP
jgi:hypothetical protein